ncbi:MAG: hypothetical protein M5R36_20125 [Deltaproteobacteria bacterium]|nr:hypothetical protein [Deltaproteobacteria bacterium]
MAMTKNRKAWSWEVVPATVLALTMLALPTACTCGDDDDAVDDDGNDDEVDDDDTDDDTADDDDTVPDDDTEPPDDDTGDDDTGDDDTDVTLLDVPYGPVDFDGGPGLEYLYVETTIVNEDPDGRFHYVVEVRDAATSADIWSASFQARSTSRFSAVDLDGDGIYEIVIRLTDSAIPTDAASWTARVQVVAGSKGFETVFDTGIINGYHADIAMNWDFDRDGFPEFLVSLSPEDDVGERSRLTWYEAASGYSVVKEIVSNLGEKIEAPFIFADVVRRHATPADFDGNAGDEYLLCASRKTRIKHSPSRSRCATPTATVSFWSRDFVATYGYIVWPVDSNTDGTFEIAVALSDRSLTSLGWEYSGRVVAIDGSQNFADVLDTGEIADRITSLWPYRDLDADGRADINALFLGNAPSLSIQEIKSWEVSGTSVVLERLLEAEPDESVDWLGAEPDILTAPVDVDGLPGRDPVVLREWKETTTPVTYHSELTVCEQDWDTSLWTTQISSHSTSWFFLVDVDADEVYEVVAVINDLTGPGNDFTSTVRVYDGNDDFAIAFEETFDKAHIRSSSLWDFNRDGVVDVAVANTPQSGTGQAPWMRWYASGTPYHEIKEIVAPVGSTFQVYGGRTLRAEP